MSQSLPWRVLLIGGSSGTGKTTVAREIGLRLRIPWLMVDDVRLALQRSRVQLPERTDSLYVFADLAEKQHVWQQSPEVLRDALIAVGEAMSPALEAIIENHVDQRQPTIIEGDGILPSLLARPAVQQRIGGGQIQAVFIVEPDEEVLRSNIRTRARGTAGMREVALRTEARAKWLFGQWLTKEAHRCQIPVLEPRPWETLTERVLQESVRRAPSSAFDL